jgi:GTP-binding nuclear protein Ran
LGGDPNLYLVEAPALQPAEFQMDAQQIQQLQQDLQDAEQQPLPDEDDEEFK